MRREMDPEIFFENKNVSKKSENLSNFFLGTVQPRDEKLTIQEKFPGRGAKMETNKSQDPFY